MIKFAVAMIAYALGLVGIAGFIFASRFPQAREYMPFFIAALAVILSVVCVVFAFQVETNRTRGMIAIHGGICLPLLISALCFWLASRTLTTDTDYYNHKILKNDQGLAVGTMSIAEHPRGYDAAGYGAMGVLGLSTFTSLLLLRPKPKPAQELTPARPPMSSPPAAPLSSTPTYPQPPFSSPDPSPSSPPIPLA